MGTGAFALGFQQGQQRDEERRARAKELADEQRKTTLKTLLDDAETPQDKVAAIQAVYHQDPGVLKQHVENLTRKLTGKASQPVVSPADAQAGRLAPLAARGKTPEQQREAGFRSDVDYQNQAGLTADKQRAEQEQQRIFGLIDQYVPDPAANKAAKEDYVRKQAGITQTLKNLPGAAGQPYKTPNGTWVRPVESADGAIVEQPMPAGYAGPTVKPVAVNREYADLYSKALMAKRGGTPLTPEESAKMQADYHAMVDAGVARMDALAAAQAGSNVVDATDPDTGASVKVTRAQAVSAANAGRPYGAAALSTP
jgi:hypothetical protein